MSNQKKRYFYLTSRGRVISVVSKGKPSWRTMPKSGTWVVREYTEKGSVMPAFPEIVFETLKKMSYIGSLEVNLEVKP